MENYVYFIPIYILYHSQSIIFCTTEMKLDVHYNIIVLKPDSINFSLSLTPNVNIYPPIFMCVAFPHYKANNRLLHPM